MEWVACWGVLGVAVGALLMRAQRRLWAWGLATAAVVGMGGGQWVWQDRRALLDASARMMLTQVPQTSGVGGYVSSNDCRSCHPDQYESWHRSYHRSMTQKATPETVKADFDNVRLSTPEQTYVLERKGDEFWVNVEGQGERRVGMVTGSHHMQVFWMPGDGGNMQHEFPFTFLLEERRWVPRRDVFLIGPEYPKNAAVWNYVCIECHATRGQPHIDPKTEVAQSQVAELGIACESCHGPGRQHVLANLNPVRRYFLHVGGQSDPSIANPARMSAQRSSEACAQCHGISCNLQGWSWEGLRYKPGEDLEQMKPVVELASAGRSPCKSNIDADPAFATSRYWRDGQVRVSGREYNALNESRCFAGGKLSCTSCHSLHQSDPDHQVASRKEGAAACTQCHEAFAKDVPAHTHHAVGSAGSDCYNCHMPNTTYGLMQAMRSHRITRPSAQETVDTNRPNACNLCHLDKTLAWTGEWLERWYGKKPPALSAEQTTVADSVRHLVRGDAGERSLVAWSMGWPEAQKASGTAWMAPYLGMLLEDRYAATRYIAQKSLRTLPGFEQLAYDFIGDAAQRARVHAQVDEAWRQGRAGEHTGLTAAGRPELLLSADGAVDAKALEALLSLRHDGEMFLAE